jgi:hypothetical protein
MLNINIANILIYYDNHHYFLCFCLDLIIFVFLKQKYWYEEL